MEGIMDDDDKEKSVIGKVVDAVTSSVGDAVKVVMPTPKPDTEEIAERTNEQMLVGDAAIAPEAVPALIAPKKTAVKKRVGPQRANKRTAKAVKKRRKKSAAKKASKTTVAKKAKKAANKGVKKTSAKQSVKKSVKKSAKKKKKSQK
jgi:hypothetical protein